jgi:hypothetical protein
VQRNDVIEIADGLLARAVEFYVPGTGRTEFPGAPSVWGARSDGMEGFARTLLLSAFRLRGTPQESRPAWLETFQRGLNEGPQDGGWVRPQRRGQSVVESASVALSLQLAPDDLWHVLDSDAQARLVAWMQDAVTVYVNDSNWLMFSQTIAQFLVMVGQGDAKTDAAIDRSRSRIEAWYRGDGLYTDGDGQSFDYYNAWAFHYYPPLLAYLNRDAELMKLYGGRLSEYVPFLRGLLDPVSGAPVYQGRSLIYRFAAASPLAMAALFKAVEPEIEEQSGASWSRALRYFIDRGAIKDGVLVPGWHGHDARIMQRYSGPASPYWASKAFVSLLIDDDAVFWKGSQDRLSFEIEPTMQSVGSGLLATNTSGVAVLHNHGGDQQRSHAKSFFVDDPLYARRSYSSRTSPQIVNGLADNSLLVAHGRRLSQRGRVRSIASGDNWVSSEIRTTLELPWARHRLFEHPKLSWIGPRVRSVGAAVRETTMVCDDGTAIHLYIFAEPPSGDVTVTGWAVPVEEQSGAGANEQLDQTQLYWKAIADDTTVELRGLLGFNRVDVLSGAATTPHTGHVRLAALRGLPHAQIFVLASRIGQTSFAESDSIRDMECFVDESGLVTVENGAAVLAKFHHGLCVATSL